MSSVPASAGAAALQAAVATVLLLGFGYLLAGAVLRPLRAGAALEMGLAFPALCGWVLVLAAAHMATGGAVLSDPALVRTLTAVAAIAAAAVRLARRRPSDGGRGKRADAVVAASVAVAAIVVWGRPVADSLPLPHNLDMLLHMGWATQFLNGEPVPSAAITGDVPNYYPWLYHAVVAFIASFLPGGRAFHALGPLQLVQVAAAALALFALGLELRGRIAGAAAALFGALMGGFGWVLTRTPEVVMEPRARGGRAAVEFAGDFLFKRSYSFPFQNLAPPFPRDASFTMLLAFAVLLVAGIRRRSPGALAGAGVALGMTGLMGAEAFLVGGLTAVIAAAAAGEAGRLRTALAILIPAAAVYSLWLVPLGLAYARLDGFVNITRIDPLVLPLGSVLGAWGIATPFALVAAYSWLRRRDRRGDERVAIALAAAAALAISAAAAIPAVLGDAFDTLGRHHRYWPLVHLAVVVAAALGAATVIERVAAANRAAATVAGALVAAAAVPSPLLASSALGEAAGPEPLLHAALTRRGDTMLEALAPAPGRRCVAAVHIHDDFTVFAHTGYRLVLASWTRYIGDNRARLRWAGIYDDIPGDRARERTYDVLVRGLGGRAALDDAVERFDVDYVTVAQINWDSPAYRGLPYETAVGAEGRPVRVYRTGRC